MEKERVAQALRDQWWWMDEELAGRLAEADTREWKALMHFVKRMSEALLLSVYRVEDDQVAVNRVREAGTYMKVLSDVERLAQLVEGGEATREE